MNNQDRTRNRVASAFYKAAVAAAYMTGLGIVAALVGDRSWWAGVPWSILAGALVGVYVVVLAIAFVGAMLGVPLERAGGEDHA